jgi:hypothetical protein
MKTGKIHDSVGFSATQGVTRELTASEKRLQKQFGLVPMTYKVNGTPVTRFGVK